MKVYYYGSIVGNDSTDYSKYIDEFEKYVNLGELNRITIGIDFGDFDYLKKSLRNYDGIVAGIDDSKTISILDKTKNLFFKSRTVKARVIYEIITDQKGKKYGKELLTGFIFPLPINRETKYYYGIDRVHTLKKIDIYSDDNVARFKYILTLDEVASINAVNEMKNLHLKPKDYNAYIDNLKYLFNENVFKNQIIEKQPEPLQEQNELTKIMEDIEFLLIILKRNNIELYNKHLEEYKNIKNSDEKDLVKSEPTKKELSTLLSSIKLSVLICEENCNNILDYLNIVTQKYFEKMQSNGLNNQDLNINDLDNITEMFLKDKDAYSIQVQRDVLKRLSLLYLFVVKSNIDKINIEGLNESYFKDNLKTILLSILTLNEVQIIKNAPNVNFDDNVTVESIFDMIKEIEFNKADKDKVKNLIK